MEGNCVQRLVNRNEEPCFFTSGFAFGTKLLQVDRCHLLPYLQAILVLHSQVDLEGLADLCTKFLLKFQSN